MPIDPVSFASLLTTGGKVLSDVMGASDKGDAYGKAASGQQSAIDYLKGAQQMGLNVTGEQYGRAEDFLGEGMKSLEDYYKRGMQDITTGYQQAISGYSPYAQTGISPLQQYTDIATGAVPLETDPAYQRQLNLGMQQLSAGGMSASPSAQAELQAALLPGLVQRQQSALMPLINLGYGATGNLANLYTGQAGQMAGLQTGLGGAMGQGYSNLANLATGLGQTQAGLLGQYASPIASAYTGLGERQAQQSYYGQPDYGGILGTIGTGMNYF